MTAYINIGSNCGDSKALIGQAVAAISSRWSEGTVRVSELFTSPPWGYVSDNEFTNVGVALELPASTDVVAFFGELIAIQDSISPAAHRNADGTYCDRELDIDLIAVDSMVIDSPYLTLPHPRMHLRPFVLVPLSELAPEWRHPLFGLTAGELLTLIGRNCAPDA